MRDFQLEVHFSQWEFKAKYHMTASDAESMSLGELMSMATEEERRGLQELWLGYTETWGAPDLRQSIAGTYDSMTDSNVLCFAGAEEAIYTAMRVLLNKDDHAIVVVPNYQAAETLPLDICEVSGVALHEHNHWQMDLDEVARAIKPNTRLISINMPNNPTGATMPRGELNALVALCRKHDIVLFSDEVFRLLELDDNKRMPQIADIYENGISLGVMSKSYGLPGLRIGWLASGRRDLLERFERYKHFLSIANSGPSERLSVIALRNRNRILDRNRALLGENLKLLGAFFDEYPDLFDWYVPDGGCILYPRYTGRGSVERFCEKLVTESGVLLLPASVYRSELMDTPNDRFRIGFGRKNIEEGLDAFRQFIDDNQAEIHA